MKNVLITKTRSNNTIDFAGGELKKYLEGVSKDKYFLSKKRNLGKSNNEYNNNILIGINSDFSEVFDRGRDFRFKEGKSK